ncbi:putative ABC transport system permease protein [Rhizobium sp. PP-F2F-G38]|uniref:ABC transporter permease n=1 Tax=Ferranicluibacter rubi TaxID=2715133 RepID=A0AA43ZI25_9HYPH|nr:ABC transporter permease [Ferranicluibacter rubi]PYE34149.1 putative ABC transport system permease protein [Rhizobium sp. PP-WC-1G-195]PYE96785.1 putative ABC transport system permease protein [Rhizobium sp. PP-F2F-G38]TCP86198.1 putative ABC transport system permease protein [Rhizobium sp. PP-CC-2G-626]TCQ23530.1 putative ABC transport system permease protein [Rhizobium sp. PP-CC-3G-465]NHT77257.1 ABC transporter permease [Ferranicluibacter rubi]
MIGFILADIRRHKGGTIAILLLVAFAVALAVSVTLQERALRLGSARAANAFDLVIGAAGSETQLVLSSVFLQAAPLPLMEGAVLQRLAADPRVAFAAPIGFGDSFAGYPLVGTSTALVAHLSPQLQEGAGFRQEGDAVIGSAVDLSIGAVIKPMHGTAEEGGHTHTGLAYAVVGRMKPTGTPWDRAILVPIQAVWELHGMGHDKAGHEEAGHEETGHAEAGHAGGEDEHSANATAPIDEDWAEHSAGVPAVLVKPKTIADAYKLRQEYRSGTTLAVFPGEVLTRLYATLGDAKILLMAVAIGTQVLIAAALLLVTIMHVGQRRRQIGALRAFGASRTVVFRIVWLQLFAISLAGILIGFGLGYLVSDVIGGIVSRQNGFTMPVTFARGDLVFAASVTAFAAVLAVVPAVLAYRQSPAAALKG